jgi:hypothetical protein
LLSLAGAVVPFVIVATANATTITGGEDFRGIVNFLFTPLGLILLVFSLGQFTDVDHRRLWGSLVAVFSAIEGFLVLTYFGSSLIFYSYAGASYTVQFLLFFSGPIVGFTGGVWGVFWKRSWKQGAAIPELAGASRKALIGGAMMLFTILPLSSEYLFSLLGAFLLLVFSLLVYREPGDTRLLGVLMVAGSLLAGYPFYGGEVAVASGFVMTFPVYVRSPFFLYTRIDPVWTTWAFIGLAGLILAIIGGLQTIFWKKGKLVSDVCGC